VRRAARYLSFLAPILVVLAFSKVHARYVADPPYDYTGSFRFAWSLGYAAVLTLGAYAIGLPDLPRSTRQAVLSAVGASVAAAATVSLVQLLAGDALLPRFVVFGSALALVPAHAVLSSVARRGHTRDEARDSVAFVGTVEQSEQLGADLLRVPERPSLLVAVLTCEAAADSGASKPLVEAVMAERATVVVLNREAQLDDSVVAQAGALHEGGIRIRTMVQFYEEWLGKVPLPELERASLFFDIGEVHHARYVRTKRLLDLACALVGLVGLVVLVPFVALGNLVSSRGPLLYRQERVGRGGETFRILKFRTMRPTEPGDADADWTAVDDPRITRFGHLLRATHLDELPQVINIARGELSVVGPRPEQPRYVSELSRALPFYGLRHVVRPGLTGWAQVKYGYAGDQGDALEKLQYEFFYLRNQSLRFDLRVIGRTLRSVAGTTEGRGR
jgi:lipopolysaccharide/colanic/teichoic acid biosynthesis glycosyltransferase